jgi:hypothetical protein
MPGIRWLAVNFVVLILVSLATRHATAPTKAGRGVRFPTF